MDDFGNVILGVDYEYCKNQTLPDFTGWASAGHSFRQLPAYA
jgi:hypothetical protein